MAQTLQLVAKGNDPVSCSDAGVINGYAASARTRYTVPVPILSCEAIFRIG